MKASPQLVDAARGGDAQAIAQLLTQCQPDLQTLRAPDLFLRRGCRRRGAGRPVAALPQDRRAANRRDLRSAPILR